MKLSFSSMILYTYITYNRRRKSEENQRRYLPNAGRISHGSRNKVYYVKVQVSQEKLMKIHERKRA